MEYKLKSLIRVVFLRYISRQIFTIEQGTLQFSAGTGFVFYLLCIPHSNLRLVKVGGRGWLKCGGGGYRSRLTENKTGFSQFTKNITLAFHVSRKIKRTFWKITVRGDYGNHDSRGKNKLLHISLEKRADHGSRKNPSPTL